jgi:integrase
MRRALPPRYRVIIPLGAGCGLRQGEFFGLSPEDIDRDAGVLHVVRQVRLVDNRRAVFAPPKRGKTREVPLAPAVLEALDAHMSEFPPVRVALPWKQAGGELVTVELLATPLAGGPHIRRTFNDQVWNPARRKAGVVSPTREDGTHALRHHFASVLLDAGESIKAVSEYLGHWDAGFTLATYTHLMPSSATRTRHAIDGWWSELDGPGE